MAGGYSGDRIYREAEAPLFCKSKRKAGLLHDAGAASAPVSHRKRGAGGGAGFRGGLPPSGVPEPGRDHADPRPVGSDGGGDAAARILCGNGVYAGAAQ